MRRTRTVALAAAAIGVVLAPQTASGAARPQLDAYHVTVTAKQLQALRTQGFDLTELALARGNRRIELIVTPGEARRLAKGGLKLQKAVRGGLSSSARSRRIATAGGYTVYRPYSGAGGIEEEMRALAQRYPGLARLVTVGHSVQGKPILALEISKRSHHGRSLTGHDVRGNGRPAVLYAATQHAREWIATETDRRLMRWFLESYRTNSTAHRLVNTRDLWFMPVANPDGYDFTFTAGNRLWRKNLRDVNGDGVIDADHDGVDPNRNFATRWNYDNEGSNGNPSDETYRGAAADSEPETRAYDGLLKRLRPRFLVNYHSAAELLLYPYGFQEDTHTDDDAIFTALAGTDGTDPSTTADDDAAVEGYDPDVGAELYITNGETTDHAYEKYGTLAYTPELDTAQSAGAPGSVSVFEFPDDEAKVQGVFEKNLAFALNLATSANDPAHPRASAQNTAADYQVKSVPSFIVSSFAVSYGDPQPVEVVAKRSLGPVQLRYRINGGRWQTRGTHTFSGGERFDTRRGVYYTKLRGKVTGTKLGDRVEVEFRSHTKTSARFTYTVAYDGTAPVLLVGAEDWSGKSPAGATGPSYIDAHSAALTANGIGHAIYDIDAQGRKAPDPLGVLSHFKAVLYETGDDIIPREQTQGPGTASKLAHEEVLALRQFMNEGGRVLLAGRNAGYAYFNGYPYFPDATAPVPLADDFFQYWLGAYSLRAGLDDGSFAGVEVRPTGTPFSFAPFTPDALDGAAAPGQVQTTSSFLDPSVYPLFTSIASAKYTFTGRPRNEPFTGVGQAYAAQEDEIYAQLTRTIQVPASGTTSLDMNGAWFAEPTYDFGFVEVHTVGQDDWTTLPDSGGQTGQELASCEIGWQGLHPTLARYQTYDAATQTCTPTGTTGTWNALTGDSFGWKPLSFDLSAYAGKTIEISISYASDFAVGGTGFQADDVALVTDGVATPLAGFESDLDGFATRSGDAVPLTAGLWAQVGVIDFPGEDAAAVTTRDGIFLPFGLEQLGEADRNAVVGQAFSWLLRSGDANPA